jgi:O-antigen/teichoic acid export membrane protein
LTLKHRTFSAVRWTSAAAAARALMQVAQVAVLARLLAPEDYGLMAIVGVVLGFAALLADLGVNSAYVQRQDVTPVQRSSLFWLNVGMSAVLTVLLIATSPFISSFFGDERLTPLLMLSSTSFVISALGQQVRMSAEKALDFRPVVLVEVGAALMGFVSAVVAALSGWGVYSLIFGGIVSTLSSTVLAWVFLARGWRPLWHFRLADVRSYMGFGGALVANGFVNQINMSIDLLLGGRLLAATQLGFYSLPRNLILQLQFMVNPIITRVGFPLIAQVQSDIPKVRSIYLKTMNMTASTNAPLYVGIAFFAPEVVRIMLGEKWMESAELLRLLAVWGFVRSTGNPVGSLLMGMGRADLSLKWNIGMLFLVPPALWAGSSFGPLGLAWALLLFQIAMFIPGWFVMVRPLCQAGLWEYAVAALRPFFISVVSIYPAYLLTVQIENAFLHLGVAVAISAPVYAAISYKGNQEWFASMMALVAPKWNARATL